jgi:hypothetical protein
VGYFFTFLNCISFTCANYGLDAPNPDLTYFLISDAMSNNLVSVPYNLVSLAILELLTLAETVDTALFLAVRSAFFAVRVMILIRFRLVRNWFQTVALL